MDPQDLHKAKVLAYQYRRLQPYGPRSNFGVAVLAVWHEHVYAYVPHLRGTAPEVWLSTVMQLAKA